MFRHLSEIESLVKEQAEKKTLVLSAAHDAHALEAAAEAHSKGYVKAILVGDRKQILNIADSHNLVLDGIQIIDETDEISSVETSVKLVSNNKADILMKGKSSTAILMKAILNKEWGMRKGKLLSHFALFEIPAYHKLLGLTDVAINLEPDIEAKSHILKNALEFMRSIGWDYPKAAIIAAVEVVNPAMQATVDAVSLKELAKENFFGKSKVGGPMALDSAINKDSAIKKGIVSDVGGDADLLLFPQLESGNVMYKALAFLSGAQSASVVLGASAPVVLTSRADSMESKLNSIILAAAEMNGSNII